MKPNEWPGRWLVWLVLDEFQECRNVWIGLYRKRPEAECEQILRDVGISGDDLRDLYRRNEAETTFDNLELGLIKQWSHRVSDRPHQIVAHVPERPTGGWMGSDGRTISGHGGWIYFSEFDDYDLPFNLTGVYDLRDCAIRDELDG